MSKCVELYSYNYNKLLNGIMEYCKTDNEDLVEDILLSCGEKIDYRYIILNNEHCEDYSCYYNLSNIINRIFNVDDSFEKIICNYDNKFEQKELINSVDSYEIIDKIESKDYTKCEHNGDKKSELQSILPIYHNNDAVIKNTYKCKKCGEIYDRYFKIEEVKNNEEN